MAYLMQKYNIRYDYVYNYVKAQRSCMKIRPNFIDQLRKFEVELKVKSP